MRERSGAATLVAMRAVPEWLALTLALAACSGDEEPAREHAAGGAAGAGGGASGGAPSGGAGGGAPTGGAGGADAGCGHLDTLCPPGPPFPGAPCALLPPGQCSYGGEVFQCIEGHWQHLCLGGCAPPMSETCAPIMTEPLPGSTLELGHVAGPTFAAYQDGQPMDVIWGGQGTPMLGFRVRVTAPGSAPSCVLTETTLTAGTGSTAPTKLPVRLRCSESLAVYTIAPVELVPCDSTGKQVTLGLSVSVEGVGQKAVSLTMDSSLGCSVFDGDAGSWTDAGTDASDAGAAD
jgi:hypothetical protein